MKASHKEYQERLATLEAQDLFDKTKDLIWLSAYANNNPRSDYHWQVDLCYDEWLRRGRPDSYKAAYDEVYESLFG